MACGGELVSMSHIDEPMLDKPRRILDVALRLFQEKGFHATPVSEIIDEAGISKGLFYHYFESKNDLLRKIHNEFITKELSVAEELLTKDLPAVEKLRCLVIDIVDTVVRYRPHVTVFFQERRFLSKEAFTSIKMKRDRYTEIVRIIVKEGIESGELREDVDPVLIVYSLFGIANWTYMWYQPDQRLSAKEVSLGLTDILIRGVARTD